MSLISRNARYRIFNYLNVYHYDHRAARSSLFLITRRCYIKLPEFYSLDKDPAPQFFSSHVQKLLKYLTRSDYSKIFRKRNNKIDQSIKRPNYKFMTSEELEKAMHSAAIKAEELMQMPPVLKVREPINEVVSRDSAITDYDVDGAQLIFTDIAFGIPNSDRMITVREIDGTLKHADHEIRQKMNQIYFPLFGRKLKTPTMFTDQDLFSQILNRQEYEFMLDRACIQFEPNDEFYQRIVCQVYQHCNGNKKYDLLRSTRHFGPMTFYLTWNNVIDDLLLDLLHGGALKEAVCLTDLYRVLHSERITLQKSSELTKKILTQKKERSSDMETPDADFEEECFRCVEEYVNQYSSMKSFQELAVQSLREMFKRKHELQKGLEAAHGKA